MGNGVRVRAVSRTAPAPVMREALVSSVAAASLAAVLLWLGPPGSDFAAHANQRCTVHRPRLRALEQLLVRRAVLVRHVQRRLLPARGSARDQGARARVGRHGRARLRGRRGSRGGPAADALDALVRSALGAASCYSAAFPFALGAALALLALWALQGGRRWQFALLTVLTLAASPLAFVLLAVLLGRSSESRSVAEVRLAMPIAVVGGRRRGRARSSGGSSPGQVITHSTCSTWRRSCSSASSERSSRAASNAPDHCNGSLSSISEPVSSPSSFRPRSARTSSDSDMRRCRSPCSSSRLRRWRPLWAVVPALVLAIAWNVTPFAKSFISGTSESHAASSEYWAPAVGFLQAHLTPDYRVEAVDTSGHWPAVISTRARHPARARLVSPG